MEKLEQYRNYVKQVITEYAQLGSAKDEIEQQLIFDSFGDHYQLMYVGWKNRRRQHG
ncbi:element excision factor XisI family protein, partial [Dolichospermum sp. UHCC 0260]|uniref:element excision factor XisI family protein n=2 Tax=Cyanophyceae TaxID=3028117 RepID=UPI001580482C